MAELNPYLKPEILAQITKLGLRAQRVVEGTISGLHRSPLHGVSVEFADYREYAPGDDLKRLDWRAYARTNRHFVKQYEEESNLRATLMVDASASMKYGRGAMSKFNYAATIAASIAHLCIKQRDAVGMAIFDNTERAWLRPVATQSQLAKILDVLQNTRPERTTELGDVMAQVSDQIRSRGLVIIISDLLCDLDAFYKSLGRLQYSGHEVMIFHVLDREEIELPFNDTVLFKDIEGDEQLFAEPWAFRKAYKKAMETFIEEAASRCRFCGIDHVLLKTDENLGLALSHYLHQRQRADHGKRGGKMRNFGEGS
jgi:uncharacterized protein (DUF58 family)